MAITALGLLIEPSATNLVFPSQDTTNAAWTKLGCSTGAAFLAPDNSATAIPITVTATPFPSLRETFSVTAGLPYSFSCYAKQISGDNFLDFELNDINAGFAATYVNLATATIAQVDPNNWTVNSTSLNLILNNWINIRNTFTPSFSSANTWFNMYQSVVALAIGQGGFASTIGSVMSNWGMQLEQSGMCTSYIPTTTGIGTRAADVVTLTIANGTYDILVEDTTGATFNTTTITTGQYSLVPRTGQLHVTRVRAWPASGVGSLTAAQKIALAPGSTPLRAWRPVGNTIVNVTTASAIQTVINAAGSGTTIVFANGTYNLNNINMKTGVSLFAANQFGARLQGTAIGNVLQGSGVSDITIWGFTIDEGGIGPDLKGCIWMDNHSTRINIIGNRFQGYSKPASGGAAVGIFLFNPDNIYIQANEFGTSNAVLDYQPISIHSTDATTPVGPLVISDNNIHGFARFGIETLCTVQTMNVDRNNIHDGNAGSFMISIADVSGSKTQNGSCISNTISDNSQANSWGIELAQALTVSGNIISGVTQGIVFAGTINGSPPAGTKAVVQGNTMTGVTTPFAEDGGYNGLLEWIGTNSINGTITLSRVTDPNGVGGVAPTSYPAPTPPLFAASVAPTP